MYGLPLLGLLACTGNQPPGAGARPPTPPGDTAGLGNETDESGEPGDTGSSPCPEGMVPVGDGPAFCIDRYESRLQEYRDGAWVEASPYETVDGRRVRAVQRAGEVPQAYISGDEAEAACREAGKRLCTSEEWLLACQGPEGWTWPYGDDWREGACNDHYDGTHPVVDYFGTSEGVWDSEHMNDPGIDQQPGTVAPAGAYADCVSAWGAYDLHGNLHEWVADPDGTFRGGFYADASTNGPGCTYVTTAHDRSYHDYSTGFRCCAEPVEGD